MTRNEFFRWYRAEHTALHKAWTDAVGTPGYDKKRWQRREATLNAHARDKATPLGIEPPFLRDLPPALSDVELLEKIEAVFGPRRTKLSVQRSNPDGGLITVSLSVPLLEYGYVTLANLTKLAAVFNVKPDDVWVLPVNTEATVIRLKWS